MRTCKTGRTCSGGPDQGCGGQRDPIRHLRFYKNAGSKCRKAKKASQHWLYRQCWDALQCHGTPLPRHLTGIMGYKVETRSLPTSLSLSVPFDTARKSAAGLTERPLTLGPSEIWTESSFAAGAPSRLLVQSVPQRPWLPAVPARRKPRRPSG